MLGLLTEKEAAAALKISVQSLRYYAITQGEIMHYRISKEILFKLKDLEEFLNGRAYYKNRRMVKILINRNAKPEIV